MIAVVLKVKSYLGNLVGLALSGGSAPRTGAWRVGGSGLGGFGGLAGLVGWDGFDTTV